MADDASEDSSEKKKGKLNPKTLAIVAVVIGAAGYYFLGSGGGDPVAAGVPTTTIPLEEEADGAILSAGTLTVNLSGEGTRFGRVAFSLVLVEGVDPLTVEGKLPLILDAALIELANFTADDLLDASGQDDLRRALSESAREILNDEEEQERIVKRVILTDLLVQ